MRTKLTLIACAVVALTTPVYADWKPAVWKPVNSYNGQIYYPDSVGWGSVQAAVGQICQDIVADMNANSQPGVSTSLTGNNTYPSWDPGTRHPGFCSATSYNANNGTTTETTIQAFAEAICVGLPEGASIVPTGPSANKACGCPDGKDYLPGTAICGTTYHRLVSKETKNQCTKGNPIYPTTGTKVEKLDLGIVMGDERVKLVYNSARRPSPSLWRISTQRALVTTSDDVSAQILSAERDEFGMTADDWYKVEHAVKNSSSVCNKYATPSGSLGKIGNSDGYVQTNDKTGRFYQYGPTGNLISSTSATGVVVTAQYANNDDVLTSLTDSNGRTVSFTYVLPPNWEAKDRLVKTIADSQGQTITLNYDTNWSLSSVQWPNGTSRSYLYEDTANPWALTGLIDENGSRFATWSYDSDGNAISSEHAGGVERASIYLPRSTTQSIEKEIEGDHLCVYHIASSGPSTITATEGGKTSTMSVDYSHGYAQVISNSQPAGSGCFASNNSIAYDNHGNITSKVDFNGNKTCFVFDTNEREVVRVEGLPNTTDCSTVTPAGAILPTGASKITTQWHPDWKLPTSVTAPGFMQTTVYNGQPDPFNGGAIANCTTAGNLPDGKPLPLVCKTVGQATFNGLPQTIGQADNNISSVSLLLHGDGTNGSTSIIDSSPSQLTATAYGNARISTAKSKFGGSSLYFDGVNSHIEVPASPLHNFGSSPFTVEAYAYWTALPAAGYGQLLIDRWDGPSNYSWGLMYYAGQLYFLYSADGTTQSVAVSGNFTPTIGAEYHVAASRDATTIRLFVNGNQIASAPMSASIFASSSTKPTRLGAMYESTSVGMSAWYSGYLDEVRITNGVARYASNFTPASSAFYDGITPIFDTSVPNAVATFTYDAAGRVLTATDSLGKTTSYTYYADTTFTNGVGHTKGDLYQVTNAAGKSMTVNSYDPSGRILKMTDPNGMVTEMAYSPRGWVTSVSVTPAGGNARVTTYTYDNVGQVTGVTNPDGTTMSMTYDAAHRLVGATDAKGNSVAYTLDNVGNRIAEELKDPSGTLQRTLSRTFDALNRVQQVKLQ